MNSPIPRPYRMTTRAYQAAATGERILDAVTELFWEKPTDQIALTEVAKRAGVTVQTIIRRFGGKDGMMAAAVERYMARTAADREAPVDDPARAVDALLHHYESQGRAILRLLAAADSVPGLSAYAELGRQMHRSWCSDAFPSALAARSGLDRKRRLAQIVAVCDLSTWKLLRLDADLSRAQTRVAILELLTPLLDPADRGDS